MSCDLGDVLDFIDFLLLNVMDVCAECALLFQFLLSVVSCVLVDGRTRMLVFGCLRFGAWSKVAAIYLSKLSCPKVLSVG